MGAINIKHTGSGADIALSSDGTSLLLDGTAIGGGGGGDPALYRDNAVSATTPVAGGNNSFSIGSDSSTTGADGVAIGTLAKGLNSHAKTVAIGHTAQVNTANGVAIGVNTLTSGGSGGTSIGYDARNASQWGTSIGTNSSGNGSRTATGNGATALGGSYASGADSFAAAVANNASTYGATGANSIAIGKWTKATATTSLAIGHNNIASSGTACTLGGTTNTASGYGAVTIGGSSCVASGEYSTAKGSSGNTNGIRLKHATGLTGTMQGAYYVMGYTTADATPIALNTQNYTPSTINQVILPNNSAFSFSGTIIARQQAADGSNYASWEIKGALLRDANAASTVLGNGIVNKLFATAGASAWAIALTADTTNGGLKIEATGAAATDIRWVATVNTSEVTYA
jgi:hypothetical protein